MEATEPWRVPTTQSDQRYPQLSKNGRPGGEKQRVTPQRSSMSSIDLNSHQLSGSAENILGAVQNRPSALPRSTSATSQARLSIIASSRPMPTYTTKSLASNITSASSNANMSSSTFSLDSERNHGGIDRSPDERADGAIFGVAIPNKYPVRSGANLPPRLIPELQALAAGSHKASPPMSSSISIVSSPSTQMTTSPSPWSASTTATTPTSWSSTSPSVIQPVKSQFMSRRTQTVPIPAIPRYKLPDLPILKETSAASSKADLKQTAVQTPKRKNKRSPLESTAPSPPPRSSSVRRARSQSASTSSAQVEEKNRQISNRMAPLVPQQPTIRKTLAQATEQEKQRQPVPTKGSRTNQGHDKLQEALNTASRGTSRDDLTDGEMKMKSSVNLNIQHEGRGRKLLDPAPLDIIQAGRRTRGRVVHDSTRSGSETSLPPSGRSRLAKFSKLALFGRSRDKLEQGVKVQKSLSRGPAAGTGHEGYGKYSLRGRKSSVEGTSTATDSDGSVVSTSRRPFGSLSRQERSISRHNRTSQSDLDDFAASRLKPVVLVGGSRRDRQRTSIPLDHDAQRSNVSVNSFSTPQRKGDLQHNCEHDFDLRIPSISKSSAPAGAAHGYDESGEEFQSIDSPHFIDSLTTSKLERWNTSQSYDLPSSVAMSESSQDIQLANPASSNVQRKKSRRLRWNIFRRKNSVSETNVPVIPQKTFTAPEMPVSVSTVSAPRSMPFYAMIESEGEFTTSEALGQYFDEASRSPRLDEAIFSEPQRPTEYGNDQIAREDSRSRRVESVLLPSAPKLWPQLPQPRTSPMKPSSTGLPRGVDLSTVKDQSTRKPRLAQVGRIPKVVFHQESSDPAGPVTINNNPDSSLLQHPVLETQSRIKAPIPSERPALSIRTGILPGRPSASLNSVNSASAPARIIDDGQIASNYTELEIMRYPERQSSDVSISSSSDGMISIMGPPLLPNQVFFRPISHTTGEDEVWKEYDDFLDHVMSPSTSRKPHKRLSEIGSGQHSISLPQMTNAGLAIFEPPERKYSNQSLLAPLPDFAQPSLMLQPSSEEMRLRRSKIAPALHTSMDPASPFSMREFISGYNDSNRGSFKYSERLSNSTVSIASPTVPIFAEQLVKHDKQKQYENASHMDDVERTRNPAKHSERAYASLMVSRWLSFGRVLFSPAHTEIEAVPERHVLVVDGLGSEDWSIYCAVTYQAERAFVHDLKVKRVSKGISRTLRNSEHIPSNHRQAEIGSFNDRFPFPPSFFSAIVLRFPPLMANSKLGNIISECKRVLLPGGYLELMLLDLDIVNMGMLTRRAVRNLKIKMSASNSHISLKPIIDNTQATLSGHGFSSLSRCIVGVPVVGKPAGATESSSSSRSSGGSFGQQQRPSVSPRPLGSLTQYQDNFSLNDLVADYSETADAKIGRMVSRTARSWWQHCFEAAVISDGNLAKSIFADKEILRECKARASSFKLLIAYTQKPSEAKKRTMSEPSIPTLATVGIGKSNRKKK